MKTKIQINGMSCAGCVLHVEHDIKNLSGVKEAVVNLPLKRGEVTFDPALVSEKDIIKAVENASL